MHHRAQGGSYRQASAGNDTQIRDEQYEHSPEDDHRDVERPGHSGQEDHNQSCRNRWARWKGLKAWWLLPAHAVAAIVLVLALLLGIDGRLFLVDGSPPRRMHFTPTQSDVTTLISIAVTIVRLLSASLLAKSAWQMAFMLLEIEGATFKEVDRLVAYRLPPNPLRSQNLETRGRTIVLAFWLLFILTTPLQFLTPLVTGALRWIPAFDYIPSTEGAPIPISLSPTGSWIAHNQYENSRYYEVLAATGLTAYASNNSFDAQVEPVFRRRIPSISGIPVSSNLKEVTVPFFKIHSIEWVSTLDDLGSDLPILQNIMEENHYPILSVTDGENPLRKQTDWGAVTIVNTKPWKAIGPPYTYPEASVLRGPKWVIVALTWSRNCSSASGGWDLSNYTNGWGNLSKVPQFDMGGQCFALGKLDFAAGVARCRDCPVIQDGLVEWKPPVDAEVEPDPLTEQAVAFMPEVMYYSKTINFEAISYRDNIEGYTRGFLTTSYQACWNHLNTHFSTFNTTIDKPTAVLEAVPVLRLSVTTWRVLVWLGANGLVTLAGIVLYFLQSRTQFKMVGEPASTLLRINNSRIAQQEYIGSNSELQTREGDKSMRIRLAIPDSQTHPYFELIGTRSADSEDLLKLGDGDIEDLGRQRLTRAQSTVVDE